MTYLATSSSFFFLATNKKQPKHCEYDIPHHTQHTYPTGCLLNSMHFTFQSIQNKTILTTTGLHDVFAKIFHLSTHVPP